VSYGSIHKSAALDGVSFEARATTFPAPGKVGKLLLVVSKDRHGAIREVPRRGKEDVAAEVTIDGTTTPPAVRVEPAADLGQFRPTNLMERVSRYLETVTEPASQRTIETAVTGKVAWLRVALQRLVEEEFVGSEPAPKGSVYRSIRPFRETD
jgi:hypothetical protein